MVAAESFRRRETRSVQILHHEFDASEELDASIRSLLNPEYVARQALYFKGTRQVAVLPPWIELGEYHPAYAQTKKAEAEREAKIKIARAEFERAKTPVGVEAYKFRQLDSYLQVMLKPAQQMVFNAMLAGFGSIPDVVQQEPHKAGHYAYVDIPHRALIQDPVDLQEAIAEFDPTSRFSMLTPLSIVAVDRPAMVGPASYESIKKAS